MSKINTANKIRFSIPRNETARPRFQFPNSCTVYEAAKFHFWEYIFRIFGTVFSTDFYKGFLGSQLCHTVKYTDMHFNTIVHILRLEYPCIDFEIYVGKY